MRTALDTNVLSALWSNEPLAPSISRMLHQAHALGTLLISPVVYAELLAYPGASETFLRGFVAETAIEIDFKLREPVWTEAGARFAQYVDRRRLGSAEPPKRILADFLVGAHALLQADRLMTQDPSHYRRDFPELALIEANA